MQRKSGQVSYQILPLFQSHKLVELNNYNEKEGLEVKIHFFTSSNLQKIGAFAKSILKSLNGNKPILIKQCNGLFIIYEFTICFLRHKSVTKL